MILLFQNIEILSYDFEDPERLVQDFSGDATYNEHHGPIRAINGLVYRKRDGGNGVRFIVTAEDQSISLIQLPGENHYNYLTLNNYIRHK